MLAQCCANPYWSASCVMYVAGPYTSFWFLFSIHTMTSWSQLFEASVRTGTGFTVTRGAPGWIKTELARAMTNSNTHAATAPAIRSVRETIQSLRGGWGSDRWIRTARQTTPRIRIPPGRMLAAAAGGSWAAGVECLRTENFREYLPL